MGGEILDYPAKTAMREGFAKGKLEGILEGKLEGKLENGLQVYKNCIARGMSKEDALAIAEITEDDLKKSIHY